MSDEAANDETDADGSEPLSASESLALIDTGLRDVRRQVRTNPAQFFSVWGVAWLVGFGASYLAHGDDRLIPGWVGTAVPAVLLLGALVWSLAYGLRTGRGVSGPSRSVGVLYGWSWTLGFGCLFAVNGALIRHGLTSDEAALLWSSSALLLTGVLYLAGGMLWQDMFQYTLGVWSMVCAAGAVFAGVPGNFLVQSLAGGGGFLALAVYHRFRRSGPAVGRVAA
ncbi:hypothetical protein [Streptomyces sp. 150FB]|uniref:hypothetical protein n=1 Tax=Streptomyces sp. 150FB TaxID=1576605 RepID=UPI0006987EC4|nr:hypothetical protein [Streptomyces sp. 150FB]